METGTVIDGRALAARLRADVRQGVDALKVAHNVVPGLAVILVGDDPASLVYVERKLAATREAGIRSFEHRLSDRTSEADLLALVARLNADPAVHGILIQLPLPAHINAAGLLDSIAPAKDVDGFHAVNVGRLAAGAAGLVPCTPLGCLMLLDSVIADYRGLHAVVIGKSNIVGKPTAMLLLERECTVTVTHIHTQGLADIVRSADIVVAAAGHARLVAGDWVKPGAVVIDVGINRMTDTDGTRLVGDCDFAALGHARARTPVPGGVGPMTVACLLANTLRAAEAAAVTQVALPATPIDGLGSRAVRAALLFAGARRAQSPACP